jgi:sugar-phosphatase
MRYAAILSDLDGVLVDSGAAVALAWRTWALRHDLDPDAVAAVVHGRPGAELIAEFVPDADLAAEVAWLEAFEIDAAVSARPFAGAAELLAGDGVAIVTSCTGPLARARLAAAGLPVPAVLVTADRVARGKPAPDAYLLAARELGVEPAACAVLEDAPAGVAAGRAAGMTVHAVTTTHAPAALTAADDIHEHLPAALAALGR